MLSRATVHGSRCMSPGSRSMSIETMSIETMIGVASLCGGAIGFAWKQHQKKQALLLSAKEDLIISHLAKPFVAKVSPTFGPVFSRQDYTAKLRERMDDNLYHLIHGSSDRGKTVAVQAAAEGRDAVVFVGMAGVQSESALLSRVIAATNFNGGNIAGTVKMDEVLASVGNAATRYRAGGGSRPLFLVDDIHAVVGSAPAMSFAANLLRMYNDGTINVVFTVSDYSAVGRLKNVSGHSRMTTELFPSLPDEELVANLVALGRARDPVELAFMPASGDLEKVPVEGRSPLFSEEEAQHVVQYLGDHMGSVMACIRHIIKGAMVHDATTAVVAQVDATLAPVLMGDVVARTVEGADKPAVDKAPFVATAFSLLEELSRDGVDQADLGVVYDAVPNVTSDELLASVHHLVEKNIISFIDPVTVCLHERRIKWAFLEKWRDNPHVQRAWKDAKKSYGD